jgi:hypothetical protein
MSGLITIAWGALFLNILSVVRTCLRKRFYLFLIVLRICKKIFGGGNIVSDYPDVIFLSATLQACYLYIWRAGP